MEAGLSKTSSPLFLLMSVSQIFFLPHAKVVKKKALPLSFTFQGLTSPRAIIEKRILVGSHSAPLLTIG